MSKKRILISDNSKDFVQLLVEFFSRQPDIEIVGVAYDGNQTLKMIEQTKPDVLLLDLIMPEMDGFEVAKTIKANDLLKDIYIVALTGYAGQRDLNDAAESGFDYFIAKPVNMAAIKQILDKVQKQAYEVS